MGPYDDHLYDEEDEQREDIRYLEFVEHQREMLEKRKHGPKLEAKPAADPEAARLAAERLQRSTYAFFRYIFFAIVCVAGVAYFWVQRAVVVPYVQDPGQRSYAVLVGLPLDITNSAGIRMRLIPPGEFNMGSPEDEPGHRETEYLHTAVVQRPFYLAATETTQKQFWRVMGKDPSFFSERSDDHPVDSVSRDDAIHFCNALSAREGLRAVYEDNGSRWICHVERNGYRLPVEVEWEYACRAGTETPIFTGHINTEPIQRANVGRAGWYERTSRGGPHPVGKLEANPWGLYDMLGNVWEWCWDYYDTYQVGRAKRFTGPYVGELGVIRGGGWFSDASQCRAAHRRPWNPEITWNSLGFRVARTAKVDDQHLVNKLPTGNRPLADPGKSALIAPPVGPLAGPGQGQLSRGAGRGDSE